MRSSTSEHVRPIDQAVLDELRLHQGMSISDFTDRLEVTATAVRQRLDRLVETKLVERRKESTGRGRPQYRYFLTPLGARYSSVTYADLASALWAEVMELPNPNLRSRILRRVARRMSQEFTTVTTTPSGNGHEATLEERLEVVADAMAKRKVPATVTSSGSVPVLHVFACPFPDLAVDAHDRQVCEMEQDMIGEAIGQSVQLQCCRLDGHDHCQFRPINEA